MKHRRRNKINKITLIEILKRFIIFLGTNYLYIIWASVYIMLAWWMLGGGIITLLVILVIYAVTMTVALCPLGEMLLRTISQVRQLYTKKEKYYLIPIFNGVYKRALKTFPNLQRGIHIYIIDSLTINACAIGKKTIAVTRGAVETLSEEELQGIIAHELGHIYNGDTKATLLATIGNGIFALYVIMLRTILTVIEISALVIEKGGIITFITVIVKFIFNIFLFVFMYFGQAILAINSRRNELMADEFAYSLGLGNELVEALYLLQDMSMSSNAKLYEKILVSHPNIAKRIGRLEAIIDGEQERAFYLIGNSVNI
jgi:Zn-dependent protease with chaperone function